MTLNAIILITGSKALAYGLPQGKPGVEVEEQEVATAI